MLFRVFGAIAVLLGFAVLGAAKTVVHETESMVLFLIAAILISSGEIIQAIKRVEDTLSAQSIKNHKTTGSSSTVSTPCPNCSSINTDTLRSATGDIHTLRCNDCVRTFKTA